MVKYQGLIFDLDGTLSDSIPMILKSSASVHQKMGLPWSADMVSKFIGQPLYQKAATFAPGREEEYLQNFREFNLLYMPKMIKPFPGILSLLAKLQERSVKLGIVTSRHQWGADWSVELLGLDGYFDCVIGLDATERHKPEPEPALLALEKLGIAAADAIFIGDAPVDIACGKAAGMRTIAVGWGVSPRERLMAAEPDYFAATTNELQRLLLLD